MLARVKDTARYAVMPEHDFLETDDPGIVVVNGEPVTLVTAPYLILESLTTDSLGRRTRWVVGPVEATSDIPDIGELVEIEVERNVVTTWTRRAR